MTCPRLIRPGDYHHISRRCTQRLYYLRPDAEVLNLFIWCMAEGASRFGVQTIRLTILSNHYHALFYDPEGRLPDYLQWVHREIARGIQRIRNLMPGSGAVFDKAQGPADQVIVSEEGFWKMMGYIHCNPVDAGICKDPSDWPGTLTPACTRELHAKRPHWMSEKSGPKEHTLHVTRPKHFCAGEGSDSSFDKRLQEEDTRHVREQRARMRAQGRHHFKGVDKAMSRSALRAPNTRPKRGAPAFVAVVREALLSVRQVIRAFRSAYRDSLSRFRSGERDAEFPFGTWKMKQRLGCCTAYPR